jgi:serine/threonine-protein kinase
MSPVGDWLDTVVGTTLAGRYRVEALIGAGGMGAVFRGVHTGTGRSVAIKVLTPELRGHPQAVARFQQEARAAAATNRHGVVEILDFDVDPAIGQFLVMELLEGESLQWRIERVRRLEPATALDLAARILDTLAAVHAAGIVHRDLKPANIFLARPTEPGEGAAPREEVKVVDFGISRVAFANLQSKLTAPGVAVGTPRYMSPEQAECAPDVDARADLYGVGAILYESLSGVKPYEDVPPSRVLAEVVLHRVKPLRDVAPALPEPLYDIVDRAMQRRREDRYQTAQEMGAAVRGALAGLGASPAGPAAGSTPVVAPPDRPKTVAPRPRRRWLLPAAILGVLSLGGGLTIGLWALGGFDRGPAAPAAAGPPQVASAAMPTTPPVQAGPSLPGQVAAPQQAGMPQASGSALELALLAELQLARSAQAAGQSDLADQQLHKLVGHGVLAGVQPDTPEARVLAEAHLDMGKLVVARLQLPAAPAREGELSKAMDALTMPYGEAMDHNSEALRFSKALEPCVLVANGEATERLAEIQLQMNETHEYRRVLSLRSLDFIGQSAATHLAKAQSSYAAAQALPDELDCQDRAALGAQRVGARLASIRFRP